MLNPKPIAALLLLLLAAPAHAAMMTTDSLVSACSDTGPRRTTCDGYLMAAIDIILQRDATGDAQACPPETVTLDQVRDAVISTGQRTLIHQAPTAFRLVAQAMRLNWPCTNNVPPAPVTARVATPVRSHVRRVRTARGRGRGDDDETMDDDRDEPGDKE